MELCFVFVAQNQAHHYRYGRRPKRNGLALFNIKPIVILMKLVKPGEFNLEICTVIVYFMFYETHTIQALGQAYMC